MNRRMIMKVMGIIGMSTGLFLLLPMAVGIYYREAAFKWYLLTALVSAALGFAAWYFSKPKKNTIYAREGFVIVSLGWVVMSLLGALPLFLSGDIPNYLDALFETVSGLTTTGGSILTDVEVLAKCNLFWRSFTHFLGGMGVLVFIMAVLPLSGGGGDLFLMRAESPGPEVNKLVPSSGKTARLLYAIYIGLTVIMIIMLILGGMPLFDSVCLSFGTAGTGGFGLRNDSIAGYSLYSQIVINVFMTLFGVNFSLYYLILVGKIREAFKMSEVKVYFGIYFAAVAVISLSIMNSVGGIAEAMRQSFFQVSAVMTTTGYSTVNFDLWPELAKAVMVTCMCIGACAGSTGGGFKVSRLMLVIKGTRAEIKKAGSPRSVQEVRMDGRRVSETTVRSAMSYFALYVCLIAVSTLIVTVDGHDLLSNFTGVISAVNNIGPGLGVPGPAGSFAAFGPISKVVFIFDMLLGRLELYPIFITLGLLRKK